MPEEKDLQEILKDLPQSTEVKGFASDRMLTCEKCNRANPPTRMICLYCGNNLPVADVTASQLPKLKKLEDWESGYNIILLPTGAKEVNSGDLYTLSKAFNLEMEDLKKIISLQQPLPLGSAANANEASLVEKGLLQMGLEMVVVSDSDLAIGTPSQRLLGITFGEDALRGRTLSNENALYLAWDNVRLIVVGRVVEKRVETEEKISRKEVKELEDAREYSTDQVQLDIYGANEKTGWKILSNKFDFSCLGEERALTAVENFDKLIQRLCSYASKAVFDNYYNRLQSTLGLVWRIEKRSESLGLKRKNFGQMFSQYVNISSNETQFLRYSRLKAFLQRRQNEKANRT